MIKTAIDDSGFRRGRKFLAGAAVLALAACTSDDDSGDRPQLAAFNAVPDVAEITFLREDEVWSDLSYGSATSFREVDAEEYTVNFETLLPDDDTTVCEGDIDDDEINDDDECTRIGSVSLNLVSDTEYVVAILGRFENLRVQVYDKPIHEFDTDDTETDGDPEDENMEVQFFNWLDQELDVYLEPPGTNLSPVQVRATLNTGDEFNMLVDKGDYVLTLTTVGDPSDALFTSEDVELFRQTSVAFAFIEAPLSATNPIEVTMFRDLGGKLLDRRSETELRAAHTSTIIGAVDIYAEGDFSVPLFSDLAVNQVTDYLVVDPAAIDDLQLDITPAGNPSGLVAREIIRLDEGDRYTFYMIDESINSVDGLTVQDRFRRLFHYAELRLINSFGADLDFYVVPAGDNIFTSTPLATLSVGTAGSLLVLEPGTYDVVLARRGTDIFVFGPEEVRLDGSGAYTLVSVATADTTTADVILLDDFTEQ
ncbi:MAG: hypothetical protein QNJ11_08725 [Woeseiaceae bacterium]|nr:hypothetical protein [Woeseiaceae bacterium]